MKSLKVATMMHGRAAPMLMRQCRAFATSIPGQATAVRYHKHGPISSGVLRKEQVALPSKLGDEQVLVRMLAAPMNPADFNMIEGTYGIKPQQLPMTGGNEGVGVVEAVGSAVKNLKPNDWVLPARPGFGTWATHAVCTEQDVDVIPANSIPVEYAATLAVNPCTALRLLEDFVPLSEGDVVIQNGGNSLVGQSVVQIAKAKGIKTISVIRRHPDHGEMTERIKQVGGDIVVTEDYLGTPAMQRLIADLPRPKLALNCVGGKSATDMIRLLSPGATMVTFGGMSRKPVTVPTSQFIFNDIRLRGFWLSRWVEQHSQQERQAMFEQLIPLIKNKKLILFLERHSFQDFDAALTEALREHHDRKVVVRMDPESEWAKTW